MAEIKTNRDCALCHGWDQYTIRSSIPLFAALLTAAFGFQFCGWTITSWVFGVLAIIFVLLRLIGWLIQKMSRQERINVWVNPNGEAHAHYGSWQDLLVLDENQLHPQAYALSLWVSLFPGCSRVLACNTYWKVRIVGKWSWIPSPFRDLVVYDRNGCSLRVPFITNEDGENCVKATLAGRILVAMETHHSIGNVFENVTGTHLSLVGQSDSTLNQLVESIQEEIDEGVAAGRMPLPADFAENVADDPPPAE